MTHVAVAYRQRACKRHHIQPNHAAGPDDTRNRAAANTIAIADCARQQAPRTAQHRVHRTPVVVARAGSVEMCKGGFGHHLGTRCENGRAGHLQRVLVSATECAKQHRASCVVSASLERQHGVEGARNSVAHNGLESHRGAGLLVVSNGLFLVLVGARASPFANVAGAVVANRIRIGAAIGRVGTVIIVVKAAKYLVCRLKLQLALRASFGGGPSQQLRAWRHTSAHP